MTLSSYLWLMRVSTFLSFTALVLTVFYIDPNQADWLGGLIFYSCFFLTGSGTLVLVFNFIRRKTQGEESAGENLGMDFRQGLLLALMAAILLFMQAFRILTWWDGLLVSAGILLLELRFLAKREV